MLTDEEPAPHVTAFAFAISISLVITPVSGIIIIEFYLSL